jgi:hypothetical protein
VCVDYLAAKQLPNTLRNWRLGEPMSREERMARTLASAADSSALVRAHIGAELARAYTPELRDDRLWEALQRLRNDPDQMVSRAVARAGRPEALPAGGHINQDDEVAALRAQVAAYERGRFMRLMRWLYRQRHRF